MSKVLLYVCLFEVEFGYDTSYTDDSVGINFGINFGINEKQKQIIGLIRENPTITIKQLAEKIGMTARSIENNLQFLKKNGIIEREGQKRKANGL